MIVKIGSVDLEMTQVKKEEIYASKIYSPLGNLAEYAKLGQYSTQCKRTITSGPAGSKTLETHIMYQPC